MSKTIRVSLSGLGAALILGERDRTAATRKGTIEAARRGVATLTRRTPRYLGQMANSWKDSAQPYGARIRNDAPHAGVIEAGARPHGISPEGMESLTQWAQRQRGVNLKAARAMAWSIAQRIKREGQEGHWIARNYVTREAPGHLRAEIDRALKATTK